jgi:hypothetical protein
MYVKNKIRFDVVDVFCFVLYSRFKNNLRAFYFVHPSFRSKVKYSASLFLLPQTLLYVFILLCVKGIAVKLFTVHSESIQTP